MAKAHRTTRALVSWTANRRAASGEACMMAVRGM
jgi:hypothetical protein